MSASDGEPLPPEAIGVFERDGAHAEVGRQGVRVYVHREGENA